MKAKIRLRLRLDFVPRAPKILKTALEAIDAGDHALLGLLGLSAAFDTVDHDVLVERLARTYGLRSTALDWLRSYLLDCSQYVFDDGASSSVRRLVCGVPQGSVLRPLLFLLYTADVGELAASLGLSSHFYADDSQLYRPTWATLHLMDCSGAGWSWELSGSRSGCDLTDSSLNSEKTEFL